ncbi:MAG: PD-(D/E)XK nuclease family protein [Acidobacteriia bacterium]|nr:PD-(D/E)XK nuclease family protein [Terriglobia bacterium]
MPSFSHSKLTTYQQCPQKYKFRYIDEIPPPIRSIELHLGDSVHRALEKLYADAMHGRTHSCDEILSFYQQKWDEGYTPQMRIVRSGTTARTYLENGRRMLQTYHQRFYPFTQSRTLELEGKFLYPVSEKHEIRGVIDRLARTGDGSLEIHDYKTSRRLPDSSQVGSDTQLALYELALRHRWPGTRHISLIWHYLAFDEEIQITKTPQQLETIKQNTLGLIKRIESTTSFPTRVAPLCDWCEYKEICPAMVKC